VSGRQEVGDLENLVKTPDTTEPPDIKHSIQPTLEKPARPQKDTPLSAVPLDVEKTGPPLEVTPPLLLDTPPSDVIGPAYTVEEEKPPQDPAPQIHPSIISEIPLRLTKAVIEKSQAAFRTPPMAAHYVHMIPRNYVDIHHTPVKFVAPLPPAPHHYFGHFIPQAAFFGRRPQNGHYWQPKRPYTKLYEFDFTGTGGMRFGIPKFEKTGPKNIPHDHRPIGSVGGNQRPGGRTAPVHNIQPRAWVWPDKVTSKPLQI